MRPSGREPRGQVASLSYSRLLAVTYVTAAALPILIGGILLVDQLNAALEQDATARANRALETAEVVLDNAGTSLATLTASYANWPAFGERLAQGDLESIRTDILAYLVDRGQVSGGRVVHGAASSEAGDATMWSLLDATGVLGSVPDGGGDVREVAAGADVYLVADQPVRQNETVIGRLVMARRIDARFVADLRRFTGFEVAVLGAGGEVSVATDSGLLDVAGAVGRSGVAGVERRGDIVLAARELSTPGTGQRQGVTPGQLLLATRLGALQTAIGGLPGLVLGLLGLATIGAAGLGTVLAAALRRRLRFVHESLAAIADGRVPPTAITRDDDLGRVGAGLDRLVAALDRREATIRRGLRIVADVRPDRPVADVLAGLAEALRSALGCAWVVIAGSDGGHLAVAGDPPPLPTSTRRAALSRDGTPSPEAAEPAQGSPSIEAPMSFDEGPRAIVGPPDGVAWNDGDIAVLEVMALLAGTVLRDAQELGRIAGRANRLDRVNRMQRLFLRGASHNLRSPLATVELAAADLVEVGDPFVSTRALGIQAQGRRLARLIDQILLLSQVDTASLDVAADPVALGAVAQRLVREMDLEHRAVVEDAAQGAVAFADEAILEQIVWVLLDNSLRYAPAGRIRVLITQRPDHDGEDQLALAVEDEGPGIPPDETRTIFRRFVRGSTSKGHAGTGLGLYLARALARSMLGDLVVLPADRGARFELTLPKAVPDPLR